VTDGLAIRAATTADIATVLTLWRDAGAEESVTDDEPGIAGLIARDPEALLLAEDGQGRLIGSLVAGWDGWRGHLHRLAVVPDHRRRGVATALVRHGERRLVALGARRIAAIVVDGHEDALRFWEAAGYEQADHSRFTRSLQRGR
jgi:ribosomal protein S18 acetylase RimI-like enzyme